MQQRDNFPIYLLTLYYVKGLKSYIDKNNYGATNINAILYYKKSKYKSTTKYHPNKLSANNTPA